MKITIESTTKIVTLNGVSARIWQGHTDRGVPCHCYVTRIAVAREEDNTQFERELQEHAAPRAGLEAIPFHMLIDLETRTNEH